MAEPGAWHADLTLAIDGWRGAGATLFAPAHALFFQLLQLADPDAATALHDRDGRKPFALSPLVIEPVVEGAARASLTVRLWDAELISLVGTALTGSLALAANVQGHAAAVLDVRAGPTVPLAALGDPGRATASVVVTFTSPTFFSLGRRFGVQQYGLLPAAELVVGSWLRAWLAAGGTGCGVDTAPGWLAERVAVREVQDLHTVTVNAGKTALSGFLGTVRFAWVGSEWWGPELLVRLARFARYCGTGAKTGQGFGMTVPHDPLGAVPGVRLA